MWKNLSGVLTSFRRHPVWKVQRWSVREERKLTSVIKDKEAAWESTLEVKEEQTLNGIKVKRKFSQLEEEHTTWEQKDPYNGQHPPGRWISGLKKPEYARSRWSPRKIKNPLEWMAQNARGGVVHNAAQAPKTKMWKLASVRYWGNRGRRCGQIGFR